MGKIVERPSGLGVDKLVAYSENHNSSILLIKVNKVLRQVCTGFLGSNQRLSKILFDFLKEKPDFSEEILIARLKLIINGGSYNSELILKQIEQMLNSIR